MNLTGRGVIVTGASRGFGLAVAEACLADGADLLLCARGTAALEQARARLAGLAAPSQRVIAVAADVSVPEHVRRMVDQARAELPNLAGLVNNAGVYGPKGRLEDIDWVDWMSAISINLSGTVLACREVLPIFRARGYGKIVNLSGGGATAPLPRLSAYAASKAAVVRFTETLAEETQDAHIDVNAVAPGPLNTAMLQEILDAGPGRVGDAFYARSVAQRELGGVPLEKGAALVSFLLSAASDGITGRLLSAIWDPWPTLPDRLQTLRGTDIYTLRRIVPKDRGQDW